MIYQLMKRNEAWKFVMSLTIPCTVVGAFVAAHPGFVTVFCGYLGIMGAFVCRPNQHATRFEASLPLAGRQLFLARICIMMVAIWLPAIAGCGALLISTGFTRPSVDMAGFAAVATLIAMAVQSVRVRELSGPNWLTGAFFVCAPAATALVLKWHAALPVLMVCAPLSAALFVRTWRSVPKSLQIAPAGASAEAAPVGHAKANSGAAPATVWMPILRSVFSWQYGVWLLFLFSAPMTVTWIGSCGFSLVVLWGIARQRVGWTQALPIRPRVVLWTILALVLLTLAFGYFVGFHFGSHSRPVPELRDQVLNLAALLGWALLVVLFNVLFDWRRLRHVSLVVRRVLLALLLGVPLVASFAARFLLPKPIEITLIANALLRLSRVLPGSPAAVIALAAIPLAALCWALVRVFEEAEYADKPRAARDESFLRT
jgi:hypothetical protein